MAHRNGRGSPLAARYLVLATIILGAFAGPPGVAQTGGLQTHAVIRIDGDADLCNAPDVQNGVDADGIINCATADGSESAPYLIRGWRIQQTTTNCVPSLSVCGPPPCSVSTSPAAVSICNTTRHLSLESLEIENREGFREIKADDQPLTSSVAAAGLLLAGASNVAVRWVNVTAAGIAVEIREARQGETELAATNIVLEDMILSDIASDTSQSVSVPRQLFDISDADVSAIRVRVGPNEREEVVRARASQDLNELPLHQLSITESTLEGGTGVGLVLNDYRGIISNSRFVENGLPQAQLFNADVDMAANVELADGHYELTNNTFIVQTIGLRVASMTGRVQFNRFMPSSTPNEKWALVEPAGTGCVSARITYNEFIIPHVQNEGSSCTLNIPFNYWQGTAIAEGSGGFVRHPDLPLPLADLPNVVIESPGSGGGVHGKFIVQGSALENQGGALVAVEATSSEDEWSENSTADGLAAWVLSWDASADPLGPLRLWIRACGVEACGVPALLALQVVERPLPPIALLEAKPRVATIGEVITLDAHASYSPQSRPIRLYRFDLGNGVKSDWVTGPTYEIRYNQAGEFPTSVEVLDVAGLPNNNLPQAIVRIRDLHESDRETGRIPGFEAVVLVLAALVLASRRAR